MKKYELIDETIVFGRRTLFRIRALVNIDNIGVKMGDLGGYIENENNLSHEGNAWVSGDAWVFGNAEVSDDAWISGDARIFGNAEVSDGAWISGNAEVSDGAWVSGNAEVSDGAWVFGDARISGNAKVFGNARIFGNAEVSDGARISDDAWASGDARIFGNAEVNKRNHVLTIGPIGSRNDTTTFFRTKENNIKVKCGCFYGTIDDFLAKVKLTHGNDKYGQVYRIASELAKAQIELD